MADTKSLSQIHPGKGLGWMTLGASLHGIVSRLKAQPQVYPRLSLSYSSAEPLREPVVLTLPSNGIRLRFDGPDQRLRLIEIIDFSKTTFLYKNIELVRRPNTTTGEEHYAQTHIPGPSFKHIYKRLFGPAYAGEYVSPESDQNAGTYILSYPGLAIRFPLNHKSWSEKADFVSLLSAASSPATSIAIFSGSSWPEARNTLFTATPTPPRSLTLANRTGLDAVVDEIERVIIYGGGLLELIRRSSPSYKIMLGETTPQDLIAELGPPDAIFRKASSRLSIQAPSEPRQTQYSPGLEPSSVGTDHSSGYSLAGEESESEGWGGLNDTVNGTQAECFYNYFHHGFDILVAHPTSRSPPFPDQPPTNTSSTSSGSDVVVSKVFLHSNVPGSYSFNRHRRSRWIISVPGYADVTSEMHFSEMSSILKRAWRHSYLSAEDEAKMQRGMVLNRGWGEDDSPESSVELLGDFERDSPESNNKASGIGSMTGDFGSSLSNTQLFGFPGTVFEVLKNDIVTCVTVY